MNYDVVCECEWGTEDFSAKEIKEITGKSAKPSEYAKLKFKAGANDIVKLNYCSRTLKNIKILLASFKIPKTREALSVVKKEASKIEFEKWVTNENTFGFRCKRIGTHKFQSMELGKPCGDALGTRFKKPPKVDLTEPEAVFECEVIKEDCNIYLNTTGDYDLHKRGYIMLPHPQGIRPTLAAVMLIASGYSGKGALLDPFCKAGTIGIEAALLATNTPPGMTRENKYGFLKIAKFKNYKKIFEQEKKKITEKKLEIHCFDKISKNIAITRKNAEYANVLKHLKLARYEVEWLDIKFKESSIDFIITNPPAGTNPATREDVTKTYRDLFYNAKYILKKMGKVCVITSRQIILKRAYKGQGFEHVLDRQIGKALRKPSMFLLKKP